jgi:hypothetical protein
LEKGFMKTKLPVNNWDSETSFVVSPCGNATSRWGRLSEVCREKLNQLKARIASEMSFRFAGRLSVEAIRRATNEADAIAASLPYPSLLLPTLAEEKVLKASQWEAKQRLIKDRSRLLAA